MENQENFIKITGEVYKILDYLPEGDPLKNKAQERALSILENLTGKNVSAEIPNKKTENRKIPQIKTGLQIKLKK